MNLEGQRAKGRLDLRYEDVAQDGRVRIETLPVALGVIWHEVLVADPIKRALRAEGILPILSRFELEGTKGPFAVERSLEVEGGYAVCHTVDEEGTVARLLLDMDAELWGKKGRTNLPPPPDAGARALVGRVRAEHIFTRPFAPAGQRKVLALPGANGPTVPRAHRAWRAPATTLVAPPSARALEPALAEDVGLTVFGLAHTDSNQHVNSLAYPQLFEDAALRRLARLGQRTDVLASKLDIAYRRPSFAGERVHIVLRAFEEGPGFVCVGAFFGEGERDLERARVYAQMTLE